MKKFQLGLIILYAVISINSGYSQIYSQQRGCVVDPNGDCVPNTIISAMPFLRIIPDARGGGMGDAGVALSATPSSMHYNASSLAFAPKESAVSAIYTPWLQDLNINDVYMAYISGYKKVDELSTLGASFRFFSLGTINFRDVNGIDIGDGRPREFETALSYARKLGDNLSASVSGKYLFSALAPNQIVNGIEVTNATSFAADIGFTYKKPMTLGDYKSELTIGGAVTNLGAKVTYTRDSIRDFIPTNLGLGGALKINLDDFNALTFTVDINKLMIPTPVSRLTKDENGSNIRNPNFSKDGDDVADYRQKSLFEGVFGSFNDAQGGFGEELKELSYSIGAEYLYDNQFAVRAGYFYENPLKGDRKYYTVGLGLKYNVFDIDISYLVPGNNRRSPLDNTLRFGLTFELGNAEAFDK
jgi:hypothetical protein